MLQKITKFIVKFPMIEPGDQIVAGVSGGADSVCLFYLLLELQKTIPFAFCVVHVNHQIRRDAGEDAEFVRRLCEAHGVCFELVECDVLAYARENHISGEDAGRKLRYEAFARINDKRFGGNGKIAVAHHMDDQAETVLFRLFRGSGLRGLAGAAPVNGNVIRPLLCVTRNEIEKWLIGRGISYRTDSTNGTDDYARNRIRHHILPYAEENICHGSALHIVQAADKLSEAVQYLDEQVRAAYAVCVQEKSIKKETIKEDTVQGGNVEKQTGCARTRRLLVDGKEFETLHPCIRKNLIHACFAELTPAAKDISSTHIDAVCGLFEKQVGRRLDLPGGLMAERVYEGVALSAGGGEGRKKADAQTGEADLAGELDQAGELDLTGSGGTVFFHGRRFDYRVFAYDGKDFPEEIPKNDCTKWFDYDKIEKYVRFRHREPGDYLVINAAGERKSIKKFMVDEKIPERERAGVILLAEDGHVLWVAGHRISEAYKVSAQTRNVLEIHMSGGKFNG